MKFLVCYLGMGNSIVYHSQHSSHQDAERQIKAEKMSSNGKIMSWLIIPGQFV